MGLTASTIDGVHLYDDDVIVENVDAEGEPMPDGEPGARLLVTNLINRVQPLIRLAVPDPLTLTSEPCPAGGRWAVWRASGAARPT